MRKSLTFLFSILLLHGQAQFAPPAGWPGTTAIPADTSIILSWANTCSVVRGWKDIRDTTLGQVTAGDTMAPLGVGNDGYALSLGDGGYATLTFPGGITNGSGFDFAVFENALNDSFLELAKVSVSSDGIHFTEFPSTFHGDTLTQTSTFGYTDARLLNNLAGKYRVGYGTPFDLNELKDSLGIDIQHITHVRVTDVVGILSPQGTHDTYGSLINDPYPTPFATGGFDLESIGVMHPDWPSGTGEQPVTLHLPCPVTCGQTICLYPPRQMEWLTFDGLLISKENKAPDLPGYYFIIIHDQAYIQYQKMLVLP